MSDKTVKITDENFDELVINSEKLVIVDFWAEWCGPCKAIAPILDKICDQFGDKVLVGKVNVDEVKQAPVTYGIRSIPTLLVIRTVLASSSFPSFPSSSSSLSLSSMTTVL